MSVYVTMIITKERVEGFADVVPSGSKSIAVDITDRIGDLDRLKDPFLAAAYAANRTYLADPEGWLDSAPQEGVR